MPTTVDQEQATLPRDLLAPGKGCPVLEERVPPHPHAWLSLGAFFMVPRALYYERKLLAQQRGTDNPGDVVSLAEEVTPCACGQLDGSSQTQKKL